MPFVPRIREGMLIIVKVLTGKTNTLDAEVSDTSQVADPRFSFIRIFLQFR